MKRFHEERDRSLRAVRIRLRRWFDWPVQPDEMANKPGYCRKTHSLGCRRAGCLMCHGEKIFQVPTKQDKIRLARFQDSLDDYFGD